VKFDIGDYFQKPEQPLVNKPCIAPWTTMQVMPNGDMAYCEDFPDLMIGNVREVDPLKLWNSAGARAFRRRIRTKGIYRAETRCGDFYLQ
jgi:radical SAM protein with 4Fe4S-binding SPASM domain